MTATAEKSETQTLTLLAHDALLRCDGDVRAATSFVERAVRVDAGLLRQLIEPLIRVACYDIVTAACRQSRAKIWSPPNSSAGQCGERVVHLASGTLLMFPLPGGKPLKDATREEVVGAADFYARQAHNMATKARWLRLVAQGLTHRATVGRAFTEARLAELQKEATNE